MKVDLDELERVAKAATPGPWARGQWNWESTDISTWRGSPKVLMPDDDCKGHIVTAAHEGEVVTGCGCCGSPHAEDADAAHIAALDPSTALALVARIRELEDEALAAARTIEGWVTCETQFPVREDDPDWKQAERIRALVEKGINHE